jgi:TolB protein
MNNGNIKIILIGLAFLNFHCINDVPDESLPYCPPIRVAAPSPYGEPVWHPSGDFRGFNYTPLIRITYPYGEGCNYAEYEWNWDLSGYWAINPDGNNMRRLYPYGLETVSWSPDGNWITFSMDAQIFKMRFTGTTFDTRTRTQLTNQGRNFFPAWSPDGEWISYDNTICGSAFEPPPPNLCGILIMKNNGTQKQLIMNWARMPTWHPNGNILIGVVGSIPSRFIRFYPFEETSPDTLNAITGNRNRYPRYSPVGTEISFGSRPGDEKFNIYVMKSDNTTIRQLTTEGTGDGWHSWSPNGEEIVYLDHRFDDWTYDNGTLWIVNVETGLKRQLTFNKKPE